MAGVNGDYQFFTDLASLGGPSLGEIDSPLGLPYAPFRGVFYERSILRLSPICNLQN